MPQRIHFNIFLYLISGLVLCFDGDEQLELQSLISQKVGAIPGNSELWLAIQQSPGDATILTMIRPNQTIHLTLAGKLDSTLQTYKLSSLKVKFSDRSIQTISLKDKAIIWSKNEVYPFLNLIDMNFDGFYDLQVFESAGATGNFWYRSWLNSEKKGFVYNKAFSNLNSPLIDTTNKEIRTYYRAGYCEESVSVYKIRKDTLYATKHFFNENVNCNTNPDCGCIVYKRERVGKKWKTVKLSSGDIYEEYNKR